MSKLKQNKKLFIYLVYSEENITKLTGVKAGLWNVDLNTLYLDPGPEICSNWIWIQYPILIWI